MSSAPTTTWNGCWGRPRPSGLGQLEAIALRDDGAGPTLLVSPLVALMRNQIEAAARLGIRAETINSSNNEEGDARLLYLDAAAVRRA